MNSFLTPVQISAGVKLNRWESVIERYTMHAIKSIGWGGKVGYVFILCVPDRRAFISVYRQCICKPFVNSEEKQHIQALKAFLPLCVFFLTINFKFFPVVFKRGETHLTSTQ